jgi:hypothetical protein
MMIRKGSRRKRYGLIEVKFLLLIEGQNEAPITSNVIVLCLKFEPIAYTVLVWIITPAVRCNLLTS